MILNSLDPQEFARRTGWTLTAQGACKGDRCVPLERPDVQALAARLGMPLIQSGDVWFLGPESGSRALSVAPELTLPDWKGREFRLSSLLGRKVLLVAWASW
jgi:hypothetical protein